MENSEDKDSNNESDDDEKIQGDTTDKKNVKKEYKNKGKVNESKSLNKRN
jgi:hypothetical protein